MQNTAPSDVVVRIYEIGCNDGGKLTHFTVSLSMTIDKARVTDRDGDEAHDEVWKRVEKVMQRDKIAGVPTAATFIRERLIPAARAKQPGRPTRAA